MGHTKALVTQLLHGQLGYISFRKPFITQFLHGQLGYMWLGSANKPHCSQPASRLQANGYAIGLQIAWANAVLNRLALIVMGCWFKRCFFSYFHFRRCFGLGCVVVGCFGSTTFGLKHFRLKHSRSTGDSQRGGSLVCVGGAVVTRVSEPPRGCRRETDMWVHIGLRMLTRFKVCK